MLLTQTPLKLLSKCPQDHQRDWYFYRWRKYSGNRTQWFTVSLNMNTPTIIIVHQDIPGMIALVTEALSRYGINIPR